MMNKIMLLGLVLLVGIGVVACGGPKKTDTPKPESPLATTGKQVLSSPLDEPVLEATGFPGKIAFHSDRTGLLQVHVLHGDTGKIERLTNDSTQAFEPNWSPDCQALAFVFGQGGKDNFEIYTMEDDGSSRTRVFENPSADDWSPALSPKGDVIAYQTNPGGVFNVCFRGLDGSDKGCLENEPFSNASPSWSPDGERILFTSNRDGGDWDVFVVEVEGDQEPVQITKNSHTDAHPQFSPDGQHIVYDSGRLDNYDIYIANSDGTNEVQLTTDPAQDITPRWVGNDQLVFASRRSSDWDLYLINRDGGGLTRLTDQFGLDKWPVWCSSE